MKGSDFSDTGSAGSAKFFETLPKLYKLDYLVGPGIIAKDVPNVHDPLLKSWKLECNTNMSSVFLTKVRVIVKAESEEELSMEEQMVLNFVFYINPDRNKPCYLTHTEWDMVLGELSAAFPTVPLSTE